MTPFLHTSGMYGSDYGNTRMVAPIAEHPTNKNSIIVFDLSQDPSILLELGANKLRDLLYTPTADLPEGTERPALKQLIINKCPVIAPTSTLTGDTAKRLNIDLMNCMKNRQAVLASRKEIQQKLEKIFAPREYEPISDPDLMIYGGGFFSEQDKRLMANIHNTAPDELGTQTWSFEDKRLPEMLFRYRARNYPETLDDEEQAQWLEHCRDRLINGDSGHLSFEGFHAELQELRNDEELDDGKQQILTDVEDFGRELESYLSADA
jgi:exodeoxyribonuclease-1